MTSIPVESKYPRGFTLIEIIVTLVVVGILAAVVAPRLGITDSDVVAQAEVIKAHIRFAHLHAMKRGGVHGLRCDGASYWAFSGTDPANAANRVVLPGESTSAIALAGKKISLTAFTLFFDDFGRPYTAYTSSSVNTPLAANLSLTVNSVPASTAKAVTVTPETGYVP